MSHFVIYQRHKTYHLQKQELSFIDIVKNIGVRKSTMSSELNSDSRNDVYKVALAQKNAIQ